MGNLIRNSRKESDRDLMDIKHNEIRWLAHGPGCWRAVGLRVSSESLLLALIRERRWRRSDLSDKFWAEWKGVVQNADQRGRMYKKRSTSGLSSALTYLHRLISKRESCRLARVNFIDLNWVIETRFELETARPTKALRLLTDVYHFQNK